MRSGSEQTDETADGLLNNEEAWLNNTLVPHESLEELRKRKTVLSCRNDIVLPLYQTENEPIVPPPRKCDILGIIIFTILGLLIPIVSLFAVVLVCDATSVRTKSTIFGNFVALLL